MHFCEFATRLYGGFSVPRKYGLNWFMPALVNSSVGSSCGTTLLDRTNVWPCFFTKKSMNWSRISVEVGMSGDDADVNGVTVADALVRLDGAQDAKHQADDPDGH